MADSDNQAQQRSDSEGVYPVAPYRTTGYVKFFNSQKGYGFIIPAEGELEVFVHHTAILRPDGGFRSLAEGENVEFDLIQGPKGLQAANVTGPGGATVIGDPQAFMTTVANRPGGMSGMVYPQMMGMYSRNGPQYPPQEDPGSYTSPPNYNGFVPGQWPGYPVNGYGYMPMSIPQQQQHQPQQTLQQQQPQHVKHEEPKSSEKDEPSTPIQPSGTRLDAETVSSIDTITPPKLHKSDENAASSINTSANNSTGALTPSPFSETRLPSSATESGFPALPYPNYYQFYYPGGYQGGAGIPLPYSAEESAQHQHYPQQQPQQQSRHHQSGPFVPPPPSAANGGYFYYPSPTQMPAQFAQPFPKAPSMKKKKAQEQKI